MLATVRQHLIQNKRDFDFRVWQGSGSRGSFDDEWESHFWGPTTKYQGELDEQVKTCHMVEETFQQANELLPLENRVVEEALHAFTVADAVHSNSMEDCFDDKEGTPVLGAEELVGEIAERRSNDGSGFDPHILEDAIKPLYRGAKCTKLAGTIFLMNLCIVHGVSNNFSDELFALLHNHLLSSNNSLPKNYYTAKSMTTKLRLSYHSIHAYEKRCILFYCQYAEALCCLQCGGPLYRDEE